MRAAAGQPLAEGGGGDAGRAASHQCHVTSQAARLATVALRTWIVVPGLGKAGLGFLVANKRQNTYNDKFYRTSISDVQNVAPDTKFKTLKKPDIKSDVKDLAKL